MAASSSSSNLQWRHDVFINFRGEDTRRNFVSHLYAALTNARINTFLDDEKLRRGMELGPELLRAIEGSRISIVVFSQNYVNSTWCLKELEEIMKCRRSHGQVVLPVFYNIHPSKLRHQVGGVGKALQSMANKRRSREQRMEDVLSGWKRALTEAANISGWNSSNFRSEHVLLQQIVEDVLEKLNTALLNITTDFLVGLETRVQQVIQFIESQSNKVCLVGIWGMGGSGKTTTAKAIYNKIHFKFKDRNFIENIREVCKKGDGEIIHLQEQLLANVLKTNDKIHNTSSGIATIEKRFMGKRALIVLDDVNTFEQVEALCGNRRCFGSGSVLIVTSRDLRILKLLEVDRIYRIKEMDENKSLELFSWHAFRKQRPNSDFSELSRSIVAYCGGLPLALEVIGSYLRDRTIQEWESALSKLERIPNDRVQEKLKISYDGLQDDPEKDIFLDICCFFIGKDRAYVTEILNGCGLYAGIGISVLIDRSLLKVEKNNKLGMHGLLRDMGREIVRKRSTKELGKRSRLWFHEDVHDVLTKNSGTETVEGLVLKSQSTNKVCFNVESFKKMKNLRLLQLDHVGLIGDYAHLSHELRWLHWQGFACDYIPDGFYQGNLVVFELKHSNIKQVWNETKLMEKLKILNLSHSKYLENTPDFSKLPNLEKLVMKDCPSLCEVHQSIGDLRNLKLVNLKECTSLGNLPRNIYQLKSLKTLILSGCLNIDKLEEDIVLMESLTTLIAKDTAVKEVPYSIVRSKSIGYISLCGYEGSSYDVFPSLIWSWMSPTMNSLPRIFPHWGMSLSLVSLNAEKDNLVYLSLVLSSLSNLRSLWIQCHSKIQVTQELERFLDDLNDTNFNELETSHALHISDLSLRLLLIGMGSYQTVIDALGVKITQGLAANCSSNVRLLDGHNPSWLAYQGEGPSVCFQVPEDIDCCMKETIFCVSYSTISENMAAECHTRVLIINYTKCTILRYKPPRSWTRPGSQRKQDTIMSFNDEDWKNVVSNLGPGDNVEIFVTFGDGLTIKEIALYLINDQSIAMETERSINLNVHAEPSSNVNVNGNLFRVNMERPPNGITDPSQKPNRNIFSRLAKRMGTFLCLNPSRGFNTSD